MGLGERGDVNFPPFSYFFLFLSLFVSFPLSSPLFFFFPFPPLSPSFLFFFLFLPPLFPFLLVELFDCYHAPGFPLHFFSFPSLFSPLSLFSPFFPLSFFSIFPFLFFSFLFLSSLTSLYHHHHHHHHQQQQQQQQVGSTLVDPFTCTATAASALYGPLHGGANEVSEWGGGGVIEGANFHLFFFLLPSFVWVFFFFF